MTYNPSNEYTLGEVIAELRLRTRAGIGPMDQWPACTWPGGYPLAYWADDMESLCADCVNNPSNPIHFDGLADGWRIGFVDIIEESEHAEYCAHCNALICEGYLPEDDES